MLRVIDIDKRTKTFFGRHPLWSGCFPYLGVSLVISDYISNVYKVRGI